MKIKKIILFIAILCLKTQAQTKDSITFKPTQKLNIKQLIAPTTLIVSGGLLLKMPANDYLQNRLRSVFGVDFHTSADNYLPFVPVIQIYTGKYFGFKSTNDFLHQTINIVIGNTITGAAVSAMKHTFKEKRPDDSDNLSFPSGHTAMAFTNAALLYYEYKDSNLWYASSGFLFASTTGFLRIANNKHYTSDVLTGAGIGLATGLLVSYWRPFQYYNFKEKKKTTLLIYPQIGNQFGVGLLIFK